MVVVVVVTVSGGSASGGGRRRGIGVVVILLYYRTISFGIKLHEGCVRGSLIMFCNLVCQQHLQPLCLLQFFEETPLCLYTHGHPLKPVVYDTRPH